LSVGAAELQNSFSKNVDWFRVLAPKGTYRRKGGVKGGPGAPHQRVVRPEVHPRHPLVWWVPGPPSGSPSVFVSCPGKIRGLGFVSSNSENISHVAFLKHKNSRKYGTSTVASRQ
jgi:hypothetical protein